MSFDRLSDCYLSHSGENKQEIETWKKNYQRTLKDFNALASSYYFIMSAATDNIDATNEMAQAQYAQYRSAPTEFPSYDRLRLVRLPDNWLPSHLLLHRQNTSTSPSPSTTLQQYWPALIYDNYSQLVKDLGGQHRTPKNKALLAVKHRKFPNMVVARLICWDDTIFPTTNTTTLNSENNNNNGVQQGVLDGFTTTAALQPSMTSSGANITTINNNNNPTMSMFFPEPKLHILKCDDNSTISSLETSNSTKLLNFCDYQYELQECCDDLLQCNNIKGGGDEGGEKNEEGGGEAVYRYVKQFQKAIDMALNCLALDTGVGVDCIPVGSRDNSSSVADCNLTDVLPNIFCFLGRKDFLNLSTCCKTWRDVSKTPTKVTAPIGFTASSDYGMRKMAELFPNLQRIRLGSEVLFNDGDEPFQRHPMEERHPHQHYRADIELLSRFTNLQELFLYRTKLNGIYPTLFNFRNLQTLEIADCYGLKWDLGMLSESPLKKLCCMNHGPQMTGDLKSLRLFKDTLSSLSLINCTYIKGDIMNLADFPHLEVMDLMCTAVTGDVCAIGENNFPKLEMVEFPFSFQSIAEVPFTMEKIIRLQRERDLFQNFFPVLDRDSPDSYGDRDYAYDPPPLRVEVVNAGPRFGWRWEKCEVNWVDPAPDKEDRDYEEYIERLRRIKPAVYRGFDKVPPNEEEFNRLTEVEPDADI